MFSENYRKYLELVFGIMKDNADFLWSRAREIIDDVITFQNEAIDYLYKCHTRFSNSQYKDEYMARFCLPNYVTAILFPTPYHIHLELLTGYIPACYYLLRLNIETLGIMYEAENIPGTWFMRKVKKTYESIRKRNSITRFLEKINPELGRLYNEFSELHHPHGYLKEIKEYVLSRGELPPHAMGSPMPYNENDLDSIIKLRKDIQSVRLVIS